MNCNYVYTNIEYLAMVQLYAIANYDMQRARRLYGQTEHLRALRSRGISNPQVPSGPTILRATQQLRDHGQFKTPVHAQGRGSIRYCPELEEDVSRHYVTRTQTNVDETTEAQNKTDTTTTTKKTTAKGSKNIKKKEIGKIRKGRADARLQDPSTSDTGTSRLSAWDQPSTSSGAGVDDDDSLNAWDQPSSSSGAGIGDDDLSTEMETAEIKVEIEDSVSENKDSAIETVTFLEIVEQEAADGNAASAGTAASRLCICCLHEPSDVLLYSSVELGYSVRYSDMLQECFGITIDASQRSSATICKTCVNKVTEALTFKRHVLRCQTAILNLQATESDFVKEEPVDETPNTEEASMDILASGTERQNNFLNQMKDTYGEYVMYLQQNEQLFGPVGSMTPSLASEPLHSTDPRPGVTADDESFLRIGCNCALKCVSKFRQNDVRAVRRLCHQLNVCCPLNTNHLDIFLLGALASLCRRDPGAPHSPQKAETTVRHQFQGTDVCHNFFLHTYSAPKKQYDGVFKRIVGLMPCEGEGAHAEEDPLNVAQTDIDIKEEVME